MESVLESAIAAPVSAVSEGQYRPCLLFCYDFSKTTCVTSRIRHRGLYAQIGQFDMCISFLAALRTIRTKAVFVFFHGFFEKKPLCELIFVIHLLNVILYPCKIRAKLKELRHTKGATS